jgi:hypothetical protein
MPKLPTNVTPPATNAKAQAAAAAAPVVTPVTRVACVATVQYSVLGSKRNLSGGNQPRYGSNNAATLAALLAAQGANASISGAQVMAVLKQCKHTDFFGYAMGRNWLAVAPPALAAGPL